MTINVKLYHTIKTHLADPSTHVVMSDCAPINSDVAIAPSNLALDRCRELVHSIGIAEFWHDPPDVVRKASFPHALFALGLDLLAGTEIIATDKFRVHFTDPRLYIVGYRVQITEYRHQTTDYKVQIWH